MQHCKRFRRLAVATTLAALLAGCSTVATPTCPAGPKAMVGAELYFGLAIPSGGTVSETDWQRFVDEEVTPRFPDGLTVTDAKGQ